jgi:hypothetical protein
VNTNEFEIYHIYIHQDLNQQMKKEKTKDIPVLVSRAVSGTILLSDLTVVTDRDEV